MGGKILLTCGLVLAAGQTYAMPHLRHEVCELTGKVVSQDIRQHTLPLGLANTYNKPPFVTYIDVTLDMIRFEHPKKEASRKRVLMSCTGEPQQTFQLPESELNPDLKVGTCITANAQLSGDEFKAGTWLTHINVINCP